MGQMAVALSGLAVTWIPAYPSLLELAEACEDLKLLPDSRNRPLDPMFAVL
jgi:hypothetical protein